MATSHASGPSRDGHRDRRAPATRGAARRPVARWQRIGAAAGVVASVLLVANLLLLSASPAVGSSGRVVLQHLRDNSTATLAAGYLAAVAALVLVPFVASLKTFVHGRAAEPEWRWTVTLLTGAVAVTVLVVGGALLVAATVLAKDDGGLQAVHALFVAAKVCFSLVLLPLAGVVLASARTMSVGRAPVRWLAGFGAEIGIFAVLAAAGVLFDSDWWGAGEPVTAVAAFLVALWVAAVALLIAAGEDTGPSRA